jgi:hypothetical protein
MLVVYSAVDIEWVEPFCRPESLEGYSVLEGHRTRMQIPTNLRKYL